MKGRALSLPLKWKTVSFCVMNRSFCFVEALSLFHISRPTRLSLNFSPPFERTGMHVSCEKRMFGFYILFSSFYLYLTPSADTATEKHVTVMRISGFKVSCLQGICLRNSCPSKTVCSSKSWCEDLTEGRWSTSQCFANIPLTEICLASKLLWFLSIQLFMEVWVCRSNWASVYQSQPVDKTRSSCLAHSIFQLFCW